MRKSIQQRAPIPIAIPIIGISFSAILLMITNFTLLSVIPLLLFAFLVTMCFYTRTVKLLKILSIIGLIAAFIFTLGGVINFSYLLGVEDAQKTDTTSQLEECKNNVVMCWLIGN